MCKLKTLFSRVFVFVIFLASCTRVVFARMFPPPQPAPKAPSAKVFALTNAEWAQLRAGHVVAAQDQKSGEEQKRTEESKDKKEPSKNSDCSKAKAGDDKKNTKPEDDKKTDSGKTSDCEEGPGGGDGDMGGTGG